MNRLSDIIASWLDAAYFEVRSSALGPGVFYIINKHDRQRPLAHIYDQYVILWNGQNEPTTIWAHDIEFFDKLKKHIKV